METKQKEFLKDIKKKMLNKYTLVDCAIYAINQTFFDLIFAEGGMMNWLIMILIVSHFT